MSKTGIMKFLLLIAMTAVFGFSSVDAQKAIFLHHSTGAGVWSGGNGSSVPDLLDAYNTENGTAYEIVERSFPTGSYPWDNYPYDYWNIWINGNCSETELSTQCLENICNEYDLVIFKHCFPGAAIQADNGEPDVTSDTKTTGNYKAQYRALRTLMDGFSETKFMVWTLVPLHRLATNADEASRAKAFVDWVNKDWLNEAGKSHPNIFIFDFFAHVAEQSTEPENGQTYCLKYDYEGSHTGSDSHPNDLANAVMAPVFIQAVTDVFEQGNTGTGKAETTAFLYPNPVKDELMISMEKPVKKIILTDLTGRNVLTIPAPRDHIVIDMSGLITGIYFVSFLSDEGIVTEKVIRQ